ncbi:ENDOPLASMIC RETICULUM TRANSLOCATION PROTEIN SIMILAR TO SEC62 [Encephalitozoon cuniculi GB-M1]|uniref:Translocation protein SEC62 n=2 Tax=Encephalitozoon cuniculi TaxID=6035 RepID=Q8SRK3_ENCCU|nr:Sec63 complex subunit SEC62 [Encephalitozoon cuniculi GB-M1]KMV65794.1 preprotein translocase subunit Sec62 [Encephalitozoon cuniculi EcunIII-L]UYI27228.1 translocase subunit Sec62 [Encephalitozoon cuniculi]CAD25602.2 ENDOPLASMIC RETICULUM TRANSLOCATION PROTEIN SIMILAR TO SEC62 [Encephalitozoon cuniculi GB-M1]
MTVELKKCEDILRWVNAEEKTLRHRRRVKVFRGVDAVALLTKEGLDSLQARTAMQELLNESILFKVHINKRNTKECDVVLDQKFQEDQHYVFASERTSNISLVLCGVFVLVTFTIVLFRMWPRNIQQRLFSYMIYPLGGFITFIIVLAIVRLILFSITYLLYPSGIWLFPNLFEDVGFFESFVPLWEYHGTKKEKNAK